MHVECQVAAVSAPIVTWYVCLGKILLHMMVN